MNCARRGNSMDAMNVADFVIGEQMNGYDCATIPDETKLSVERIDTSLAMA
jgi:hypothetical protein